MAFLDIVVPQYKENDEIVKRLLDSIVIQAGIDTKNDIKITIVNDHSDIKPSKELLDLYSEKLTIELLENEENMGPGLTRQNGLDMGDAPYVMFMDCDDQLYSKEVLYVMISCLKDTNVDYLKTGVCVELNTPEGIKYKILKPNDLSEALHGKVFKREYINKHGIKFSPKLKACYEDGYFTRTFVFADYNNLKAIALDFPSYIWKYNPGSISKSKTDHPRIVDTFDDFMSCGILEYEFLKKKKAPEANKILVNALFGISIVLESNFFEADDLAKKKAKYEKKLYTYYKKYEDIYNTFSHEEKDAMYKGTYVSLKKYNSSLEVLKSFTALMDEYKEKEEKGE